MSQLHNTIDYSWSGKNEFAQNMDSQKFVTLFLDS